MYPQLFRQVLFPAYEGLILRRNTHVYLREYERSQWLSREALDALQLRKLNDLVDHCWRTVPFLQRHWRAAGLEPGALRSVTQLEQFPRLSKQLIDANYDDCVSTEWRGRTITKTTGGSSGRPFRFEMTMESYARRTAVMWRGYSWGQASLGTRAAYLWGVGSPMRGWANVKNTWYHRAFNRRYFDAFSMREDNLDTYADEMRRYRPDVIVAYVTPLLTLARWLNARQERFGPLKGIVTGAEPLYAPERAEIEQAFGVRVTNTYGSRETMLMASQCEAHDGLHIHMDHLVLETVDDNGRGLTGVSGDVLVTDLHNYGMPLVRYENGDRATREDTACTCGRQLPVLSSVDGRRVDMIVGPDGRIIYGEQFIYMMLDTRGVQQYQFVQTAPDVIEARLVMSHAQTAAERAELTRRIAAMLGDHLRLELKEVSAIAPLPSGKRRVTVALPH